MPPIEQRIPFNIPPEMLKGLKSGVEAFGNDPMFGEVMPWGLAGFAIGALSGLVVYAKKYSVTKAVEELDHYAAELEVETKDKKTSRSDRESAVTQLRLLKELRERFVALEPKPTTEPVRIEFTPGPVSAPTAAPASEPTVEDSRAAAKQRAKNAKKTRHTRRARK